MSSSTASPAVDSRATIVETTKAPMRRRRPAVCPSQAILIDRVSPSDVRTSAVAPKTIAAC